MYVQQEGEKRKGRKRGGGDETHDSRHFIPHELGGMVAIPILHQEVVPQRPGQHR